ncbi:hypothetical protein HJFPF1_09001 [Paramyrothecium foliicola]|nr:hypothetical protein HJFPF1_09001 [Paramyrothecium foliicola]
MRLLRKFVVAATCCASAIGTAAVAPIHTPQPMLQPAFSDCMQFHIAGEGEDCNAIIAAAQLSRAEFFRINPGVGGEAHCRDKIIPHTWYCVKARPPRHYAPNPPPKPHPMHGPTKTSQTVGKSKARPVEHQHGGANDEKEE